MVCVKSLTIYEPIHFIPLNPLGSVILVFGRRCGVLLFLSVSIYKAYDVWFYSLVNTRFPKSMNITDTSPSPHRYYLVALRVMMNENVGSLI